MMDRLTIDSIENAAIEGAQAGAIIGVHKALGHLNKCGVKMLKQETFKFARTPKEKGTRRALLELGYIKRHWIFWWVATEKAEKYLGVA